MCLMALRTRRHASPRGLAGFRPRLDSNCKHTSSTETNDDAGSDDAVTRAWSVSRRAAPAFGRASRSDKKASRRTANVLSRANASGLASTSSNGARRPR